MLKAQVGLDPPVTAAAQSRGRPQSLSTFNFHHAGLVTMVKLLTNMREASK